MIKVLIADWQRYYLRYKKNLGPFISLIIFPVIFLYNSGMFFSMLYRLENFLILSSNFILKSLGILFYPFYHIIVYSLLDINISPWTKIGKGLYIHNKGIILADAVRLGKNPTLIGPLTIGNNLNENQSPVLGDNVTVCTGARIIGKIVIGDNVIIGANAVVTKSFKSNVILGGVPAKVIKKNSIVINF